MQVKQEAPKQFELYIPDLDNLVLVENNDDGVVIRAARDNFSERRKSFFIHRLAAEGYIPDVYQWFSNPTADGLHGVKWVIDYSWLRLPEACLRRSRRFMIRLLAASCLLWLIAMRLVLVYGAAQPKGNDLAKSNLAPALSAPATPAARFLEMNADVKTVD
jgi:hypothetical protein